MNNPFCCFNNLANMMRLTVKTNFRYPLSLGPLRYMLFDCGIGICH